MDAVPLMCMCDLMTSCGYVAVDATTFEHALAVICKESSLERVGGYSLSIPATKLGVGLRRYSACGCILISLAITRMFYPIFTELQDFYLLLVSN